jgi:hypothetical protein
MDDQTSHVTSVSPVRNLTNECAIQSRCMVTSSVCVFVAHSHKLTKLNRILIKINRYLQCLDKRLTFLYKVTDRPSDNMDLFARKLVDFNNDKKSMLERLVLLKKDIERVENTLRLVDPCNKCKACIQLRLLLRRAKPWKSK